jgi:ribonuclease BN (tRNA processing enzyme)
VTAATRKLQAVITAFILSFGWIAPSHAVCEGSLALQVLGSGGPIADDGRASSGYLLWLDGQARLLVDAGGGVFLRFGEAQARFEDLDAIILTHLHTDHAADLPALLKSGYFSRRSRPLALFGPTGSPRWPATSEFVAGMINSETGPFRYLDDFLTGGDGTFQLQPHDIDARATEPVLLIDNGTYRVTAVGARHGPVPALGIVIDVRNKRIALSGDQNNNNPAFTRLIAKADLLLMANAIPEHAGQVARGLHATPSYIGELAAEAGVRQLVLTHLMSRSISTLEQSRQLIGERYTGLVEVAEDLGCYYP